MYIKDVTELYERSLFPNDDETIPTVLQLKPYIQPFERILAMSELLALMGDSESALKFEEVAKDSFLVPNNLNVKLLKRRLAYWQAIASHETEPTFQTMLESTYTKAICESSGKKLIPNRRVLRYGPHDLHEYRGKFFPQLVRSIINVSGIDDGSLVIDPTCGSGTTNCEAKLLSMKAIGVDLNPLSVLVSEVKAEILEIDPVHLRNEVELLSKKVSKKTNRKKLTYWEKAEEEYLLKWFDSMALRELEKILLCIETSTSGMIQKFFKVCLSNIIREVSWQKVTDLRVRKETYEYQEGVAVSRFLQEIKAQEERVMPYLSQVKAAKPKIKMLKTVVKDGDARCLDSLLTKFTGQCDLLITSPPYATALPYIDTDRLSLIVLKLLSRKEQVKRERELIGNREVTEAKRRELWSEYLERRDELPPSVSNLIDDIANENHKDGVGFRRRNLPALLAKYFLDMSDSMAAALALMKPNKYAFYVVGNNSTIVNDEKVEIPTDKLLYDVGQKVGWFPVKLIDMELIPSRDIFKKNRGSAESILVFKSSIDRRAVYSNTDAVEKGADQGDWDFHEVNTQEHLHFLHPYPARFIPQIPRKAIVEYSKEGDTVLDPFCGAGTTALESIILGRNAIGVDNNGVALLSARAKTNKYGKRNIEELIAFYNELPVLMENVPVDKWKPDYKNFETWFSGEAIEELSSLKYCTQQLSEKVRDVCMAVFSSIIVRCSNQDSDTRYARIKRDYESGSALKWYLKRLQLAIERIRETEKFKKGSASLFLHDSRDLGFIEDNSVDLIVTSPPYLNAYDYHKYHRHRLHWISADVGMARDLEIGKHDTFTKTGAVPEPYFDDMFKCFSQWSRVLKSDGKALIVIGDAIVSKKPVAVAERFIDQLAALDFTLESHWLRDLQTTKKSFNQKARMDKEHVLLFVNKKLK